MKPAPASLPSVNVGKTCIILALLQDMDPEQLASLQEKGFKWCCGTAGSTKARDILAAIETTALREGVMSRQVRDLHALYHASSDCLMGVLRGQSGLDTSLRSAWIRFSVVRGPDIEEKGLEWVAVAAYGVVGALIKGNGHEAFGFGISHI